jgi:shikimate kinase
VTRVLLTGMSGTGKSSVLRAPAAEGVDVVDADGDAWGRWQPDVDGVPDWMWDEAAMAAGLREHEDGTLVVAGCSANQGRFYDRFDHVVLLTAPADVMVARIDARIDNDFGKSDAERTKVLDDLAHVEPLLRRGATLEIATDRPLDEVVAQVRALLP